MKISLATLGSVAIGITLTLVILSYDVGLSWSFGDENQTTDRIIAIALVWICIFVALGFWSLYVKERRETRHLEALVENANEGILLVSSTSIITNANYTAEKIFGYALGELRGRNLSLLLPADREVPHRNLVERYIDRPYPRPMGRPLRARKKNGEEFFADISLSHFTDGGQKIIIAFVMDATDRVEKEQLIKSTLLAAKDNNHQLEASVRQRTADLEKLNLKLTLSQSLYRAMAQNFPDGIIGVMGRDMTWILVDGKGLAELGLERNKLRGDRFFDDLHKSITSFAEGGLKKVFTGEAMSFDVSIQNKVYNVSSVPIYTKSDINEILVVVKNISGQKRMEQELIKTLEKEKELNILKSRFVTMASHEFRTPLTTILSSCFLLENYSGQKLETEKNKHLNRIKHSVHGLTELLNDFLSLGKLEEGKVQVSLKPLRLRDFAEEILHEISLSKKEEQRIVFEYSGDDREVMMDKHLLRNILLNLLSNAVKYSQPAGTIGLTMSVEPTLLTIKVSDQGIGIPQEEQKHIFKRFFRANNTTDIQGTGLGLNIVRRYVRLLQGRIEFSSRLNRGTTFTITLPLAAGT